MRIAKSEARKNFSDVLDRAGRRGERVKITHYGKTLAILIPKADLSKLEECDHVNTSRGTRRRAS